MSKHRLGSVEGVRETWDSGLSAWKEYSQSSDIGRDKAAEGLGRWEALDLDDFCDEIGQLVEHEVFAEGLRHERITREALAQACDAVPWLKSFGSKCSTISDRLDGYNVREVHLPQAHFGNLGVRSANVVSFLMNSAGGAVVRGFKEVLREDGFQGRVWTDFSRPGYVSHRHIPEFLADDERRRLWNQLYWRMSLDLEGHGMDNARQRMLELRKIVDGRGFEDVLFEVEYLNPGFVVRFPLAESVRVGLGCE